MTTPVFIHALSSTEEEVDVVYDVEVPNRHNFALASSVFAQNKAEHNGKEPEVGRYKGLGEMNPETLWETTMDPSKRTILKVTIEEVVEADKIFNSARTGIAILTLSTTSRSLGCPT
jgi:DNA gyrase/topoisomerase IV subunit B